MSALGPLALGVGVAIGLLALYAAWETAFGHLGHLAAYSFASPEIRGPRIALTVIALIGFLVGGHVYARQALVRDIEELAPSLRASAQERAAIERGRAGLLDGSGATAEAVRMPGLLAYEQRIAAAPEWPLDAPQVARFGLVVALGLGSWVGGAAIDRLLDAFW